MRKQVKSGLYRQYLVRYLMILAVTGILLLSSSMITLHNTYSRLMESTRSAMLGVADLLENQTTELQQLSLTVLGNSELLPYKLNENLAYPHNITRELQKIKGSSSAIETIGIYYRTSAYTEVEGTIFTNTGQYSPQSFASLVCSGKIDAGEFSEILGAPSAPRYLSSLPENPSAGDAPLLLALFPLDGTMYSSGVMIYKIDYGTILAGLQNIGADSNVMAFDHTGVPLGYMQNISALPYNVYLQKADSLEHSRQYLFLQEVSAKQNFRVEAVFQKKVFYREYYAVVTTYLLILGGSLLLGLGISISLARRSYAPIQQLASRLPEEGGPPLRNELQRFAAYLEQVRRENVELSQSVYNHEIHTRNQFFLALLLGKIDPDNIAGPDEKLYGSLCAQGSRGSVVVFRFAQLEPESGREERKELWLMKYAACNVFENLPNDCGVQYALDLALDNGVAGLILWREESRAMEIQECLVNEVIAFMWESFHLTITCSMGGIADVDELFLSYHDAIGSGDFAGHPAIEIHSSLPEADLSSWTRQSVTSLERFLEAVHSGSSEGIRQEFQTLYQLLLEMGDPLCFRSICASLIFAFHQLAERVPSPSRESFRRRLKQISAHNLSHEEVCLNLLEASRLILEDSPERSTAEDLYAMILQYIAENYSDSNLTLSRIAEYMGLTPSYLTRYFKEKHGLSLMQYAAQVRIDKAKQLLEETNLSIKAIVEMVGFVDENNFSRSFRKRENCSPSQYRKNSRRQFMQL